MSVLQALERSFPASIFWHMPRDQGSARRIKEDIARLESLSRPVLELTCNPKAITPGYFSESIPSMSPAVSAAIHAALRKGGFLDAEGFLKEDARRTGIFS